VLYKLDFYFEKTLSSMLEAIRQNIKYKNNVETYYNCNPGFRKYRMSIICICLYLKIIKKKNYSFIFSKNSIIFNQKIQSSLRESSTSILSISKNLYQNFLVIDFSRYM